MSTTNTTTLKSKRKKRIEVVGELLEIRRALLKEVNSKKAARLMTEALGHFLPIEKVIPPKEKELPGLVDLSSLGDAVIGNIKNVDDMYTAQGYWSVSYLLGFTMEERLIICKALVAKSRDLGVKPKQVWLNIIKNPVFYEEWSDEIYGDDSGSLDEVMQ